MTLPMDALGEQIDRLPSSTAAGRNRRVLGLTIFVLLSAVGVLLLSVAAIAGLGLVL